MSGGNDTTAPAPGTGLSAAAATAPRATYRVQFNSDFTFRRAIELVDYFAALGVSHLYASPFLQARPGSTHGYDITDHNRINPEIGTPEELDALSAALRERGMGLILDFVPNHMGVFGKDNAWWLEVLEWGEQSPYAAYFDIDWSAPRDDTKGKVVVPVLGDQYGTVLASGEIRLRFDAEDGAISAWYYDHRFPISPLDYAALLSDLDVPAEAVEEYDRIADGFALLTGEASRRWRASIHDEAAALKAALRDLAASQPGVREAVEGAVAALNGRKGERRSWRELHRLLDRQAYRLAYWRVASDEINYRRFFNINDLAGLRIELPELFERTHRLAFDLIAAGKLQGLRIDHIDGLFDPREYCERLQARAAAIEGRDPADRPLYVVVEKILARYESLPDWPIAGTTGYEYTAQAGGVFVDPAGEAPLTRTYGRLTGRPQNFDDILYDSKKRIMQVNLASEMAVLAREFHRLAISNWRSRDFTANGMRAALEEVVAAFPVYRTYVDRRGAGPDDRRYIDWAVGLAKKRSLAADTSVFDFLHKVLTTDLASHGSGYNRAEVLRLAMRFQQVTGPVMAKGYEDTAYYRYFRLIALNEVGGDPRRFGISVAAYHHLSQERLKHWPDQILATSTHDTKRGEDARMRIALLSEMPRDWRRRLVLWMRLNRSRVSDLGGEPAPTPNHEILFYQTAIGAWPIGLTPEDAEGMAAFAERVDAYMAKAVREGKENSGWANPDTEYEAALSRFVRGALEGGRTNPFLSDLHGFAERLMRWGAINSLAQTLLKLTSPGVPDTYQGGEMWDLSMVDPDNRRAVDFGLRRRLLAEMRERFGGDDGGDASGAAAALADLSARWQDGREKLFLTWRTLAFRATHDDLFRRGEYVPVAVEGARADHVLAFLRIHGEECALVAVPRLVARLHDCNPEVAEPDWGDTALILPDRRPWRSVLSGRPVEEEGGRLPAARLFREFPVALLRSGR